MPGRRRGTPSGVGQSNGRCPTASSCHTTERAKELSLVGADGIAPSNRYAAMVSSAGVRTLAPTEAAKSGWATSARSVSLMLVPESV